ncbi:MAG: hypothetical protein IJ772_05180 [Bacilli bacterium]|nr:hypothetical protein [Bacilli bacterium]
MASTLVDFIPKISATGDFKKITDHDLANYNNKVSTLLNFLVMIRGKNSIFPNLGGYNTLCEIPYSESPNAVVAELSSLIGQQLDFPVEFEYELTNDGNLLSISMTVDNLPKQIKMDVRSSKRAIKLINPRLI